MGKKISRKPNDVLMRLGTSTRWTVERILAYFDAATPAQIAEGSTWYEDAHDVAVGIADRVGGVECAAAIIAHLSPRLRWGLNVLAAVEVSEGRMPTGSVIRGNAQRAMNVVGHEDPESTFTAAADKDAKTGHKTLAFYHNILLNDERVTVDIWALRAALGLQVDEAILQRAGVYGAIEHCYKLAAARRGVSASTMQATVWCVVRGSAN